MERILLLVIGIFMGLSLFSQESKMNRKVFDSASNHEIMIGYCNLAGITDTAFNSAFTDEYNAYAPDKDIVDQIYPLLGGITVTVVMGTWCSDSREQVPKFFKVFGLPNHPFPDPIIICVDRKKKAGDVSLEGMNILKVPTFIVYYYDRELGRIVETPQLTIEKDFLAILKKNQ
jgi:hypothetical protein